MREILDIVNEDDEVIGQVEREEARQRKLSTRRVFVLFYDSHGDVLLQRRSMQKKTSPGLLTTTVGGHVESGMTYDDTMVKETLEESGVAIDMAKISNLGKWYYNSPDGMLWINLYLYPFEGGVSKLTIEPGEIDEFKSIAVTLLKRQLQETPELFSPILYSPAGLAMIDEVAKRTS